MKNFWFILTDKLNTKPFIHLKVFTLFFVAGLMVLLFFIFTTNVRAAWTGGSINVTASPNPAGTTINISGNVIGGYNSLSAYCVTNDSCPDLENVTLANIYAVRGMKYRFNSGPWTELSSGTEYAQTLARTATVCSTCAPHQQYEYAFSKSNIDISSLVDGTHTVEVLASDSLNPNGWTDVYSFTKTTTPTLSGLLTPTATSGQSPLLNVGLTATITGGTATGNTTYSFYCTDSSPLLYTIITPLTTYTPTQTCDYASSGNYRARVVMVRQGVVYTAYANIVVSPPDSTGCATSYSCNGNRFHPGLTSSIATSSIEIYEANGSGQSLWGSYCNISRQECAACNLQDYTDVRTPEITSFQYRFDDAGNWTDLIYPLTWYDSSLGWDGCYIWTGDPPPNTSLHDMYKFNFSLDVSGFSAGSHYLNLRVTETSTHEAPPWGGGEPYTYTQTYYSNLNFTKAGGPTVNPISPMGYLNFLNPDPVFRAQVTDDNDLQVHAHFQVIGSGSFAGSIVNSGEISSIGPVTFFEDGTYLWYAWAENSIGTISSDSDTYAFTRDTVLPIASISYPIGNTFNVNIPVNLYESDERTGVSEGNVQVRSRIINGTWGSWGVGGVPDSGNTLNDFTYVAVSGREYEFQYRVIDGAGNVSFWVSGGTVTVNSNSNPTATNLIRTVPDFCSASPAYFFSWTYSDPDGDSQSGFDFQIDDSGAAFPSPEINRSYSGLSNPSSTTNNQAVIVSLSPQSDYLTYGRTYNWRVRVFDENNADSGWVNGTVFFTPSHHLPSCSFNWLPVVPVPGEAVNFVDNSICYNSGGSPISCTGWSWVFTDGNPNSSNQQNPVVEFTTSGLKNIILTVIDSLGGQCSATRQVNVNLLPSRWREIRPW